ncbi:hypothetical protein DSO57_1024566 [Entomophthora muscae]|uniref:Uncharacterized protein n=1 Tax=Entomophthora muscae TaxID=34485 RepID=A0ACC2S4P5_9FUNG|nr:hypothetical protein DSO57_1024566 [Entomophthora muscae]
MLWFQVLAPGPCWDAPSPILSSQSRFWGGLCLPFHQSSLCRQLLMLPTVLGFLTDTCICSEKFTFTLKMDISMLITLGCSYAVALKAVALTESNSSVNGINTDADKVKD